jgi:peptide/nickel transport system substrate-binding protein
VSASIALVAAAFVALAAPANAATPKDGLVIAKNIDDLITMDPAEIFEFSGGEMAAQMYDRLMIYDAEDTSKLVGGVAESWTVDGKTFTFKIRKGLTFHSGNPLRAQDVAFSLRRVIVLDKTPAFILSQFGWTKDNVEELITAPDDETLVLKITADFAPSFVLNCLSAGVAGVVDEKVVRQHEKDGDLGYAWMKTNEAGSGAYALKGWKPNDSVTFEAFPKFRHGAPPLKRIIVRHVKEPSTQRLLLEKGDVDVARNLSPDQIKSIEGNKEIRIESYPKADLYYMAINQKDPNLSKPEVRQALRWLIDYQGMASTFLKGQFQVHQAFWPQGFDMALNDNPYKLDVAKAKELLAKAGLADGFEMSMDSPSSYPQSDISQSIQATFAQAGIKLNIIPGDQKQVITKYRARNHQSVLLYWSPDYMDPHSNADTFARNPDNSDDAKSKPLAWRNAWEIPELTKEADAAVLERDTDKRREMYLDMQKKVQEDSPFLIMFQSTEQVALRDTVKSFVSGPTFDQVFYRAIKK